jgi:hypothetical protein
MSNTLLMPFIDASESFTNGFECGQIWQRVSDGESFERCLIHSCNVEQIKMICESFGVKYSIKKSSDSEWSLLTVTSVISS